MALQTATNPQTGERVALVGDSWQPILQSATNKEGVKAFLVGDQWLSDAGSAFRKNVAAESDVPLLAADIRKSQKEQPKAAPTADEKSLADRSLLNPYTYLREGIGALETPIALAGSAFGAGIAGPVAGVYKNISEGTYGQPINDQYASEVAQKVSGAFAPRTAEGRRNVQAIADLANSEAGRVLQGTIGLPATTIPAGSIAPALEYTAAVGGKGLNTAKNAIATEAKIALQPITNALETRAANKLVENTAKSFERGPQIDAAKEANRLGIAVNPVDANPTFGNKLRELAINPSEANDKLAEINKPRWANVAKAEMGLPETTALTSPAVFDEARNKVAGPYNDIRAIEHFTADQNTIDQLDKIRPKALIGGKTAANTAGSLVDDAIEHLSNGISGNDLIENISQLTKDANRAKASIAATADDLHIADVKMKIVSALEGMIDSNVSDPKLLSAYKKARAEMARSYAYEAATDLTTGYVDPQKLKQMLNRGIPLSGDAKAMANIAGNFPDITSLTPIERKGLQRFSRSGALGTAGAVAGSLFGVPGALIGGTLGAGAGAVLSKVGAKRIGTPAYQAAHAVPEDFRPPVNMLRPVEPNMNRNLPTVFNPENATLPPEIRPNWVPGTPNIDPRLRTLAQPPQLSPPSGASVEASAASRAAYDYAAQKAAEEQAQAQAGKPTWMSPIEKGKPTTSGGLAFELDPITGKLREVSQGMKGATPDVMQNYGSSLESAVKKVSAGKAFDLTAEERIAFNKTKVDLAQVEPGYAKLSDKQITERMMDRKWVEDTVKKAREQALAFEQIAARAESEQAKMTAMAQRQRMMDLADSMEEKMRQGRPDNTRKSQGPKTREAKRNALAPEQQNQNALTR